MRAVIYDTVSGEIVGLVSAPAAAIPLQISSGQGYIEGEADDVRQYVDLNTMTVTDRPAMPIVGALESTIPADAATLVTFTGVPAGARVRIEGPVDANVQVDDGQIDLTFAEPGDYTVHFSLFPYIDHEAVIHAT